MSLCRSVGLLVSVFVCRYYGVCCINQFVLSNDNQELVEHLVKVYFVFFQVRAFMTMYSVRMSVCNVLVCVNVFSMFM